MPIIHQHTLKEHDVEFNSNVFYLFIENEKKKGGDYVSTMLRDVPNGLPMTLKRSGGSGIVIVRVPGSAGVSVSPGSNSVSTIGPGDKVATFNTSGTLTLS